MADLTERQEQCLRLTATMTDKEIARELGLSPHTVNMHIRNAMEKLGATSRRGALRAIAGNSLGDSPAMVPDTQPLPAMPVVEPTGQGGSTSYDSGDANWLLLPAMLPGPPSSRLTRTLIVFGLAFLFLAAGASLLGLFGMVADHLNRWAVDPNNP